MIIGSNIALSLGMIGALSIIRFRTVVKDTKDTAYIFWSLAAGMAAGTGSYFLAIIGISSVIATIGGGYTMQVYTAKGVKIAPSLYFLGIIASTIAAIVLFVIFENFGVSISVIGIVAFNFILFEILFITSLYETLYLIPIIVAKAPLRIKINWLDPASGSAS